MTPTDTLYREEQSVAPLIRKLRKVMAEDSRFELMRMLEAIIYQECQKVGSGLPIIDVILDKYSPAEIRSLAASYGVEV
jgi:hypothetical protein